VQAQIDNMKGTYLAQAQKRQKTASNNSAGSNNKYRTNKSSGDLHTLMDDLEQMKARLEQEIEGHGHEGGKRKREENESLEIGETDEEKLNGRELRESLEQNFSGELAELSLSDVHESDLEDLDPLSDEELDA
jgi:hypothetical protein